MTIGQAICTSFKQELLVATHNFTLSTGHTFKIALYTSSSNIGAATTAYGGGTATNEVANGGGYSTGGVTLTNVTPTTSGTTALTDFGPTDPTWATSTITARGALIYNSSASNKAVVALDFGADKASSAGDFTVVMPAADSSNAIIRIV